MRDYLGPIPYVTFDTNCLNSKGRMQEMNYLDELHDQSLISIHISETMLNELPSGGGSMRNKAYSYVFFGGEPLIEEETQLWQSLRQILFPGKETLSIQEKRDVQHIFDHKKYVMSQWTYFVTNDRHFLDHKDDLMETGILVGKPEECMHWLKTVLPTVRKRISQWQARTQGSSEQNV